ncbi:MULTISPECIES: hypothetical protein [unclassified Arsukibacterium]|uniref:hypothetical protein n=1 Tax=unclassified Arsukibacterium TaxID=2635278 RepID=UPI000C3B5625|nr:MULTISPECIES: hypothetical protein [unclassified Arsukibacterium]MBM35088.1 hypothetical protein [Rheinheimera sp.]|tara:strand:- start:82 stop:333 length:252 start_codon:yes stop_codon:yes gene_type:complete
MKQRSERPEPGTAEFDEWLDQRIAKRVKELENVPELEDEFGVLSGSLESMTNTDAEAFPDEPEEYMPHERVKIVVDNSKKEDK